MTRRPPLHQFQITKQKERFKLSFVHRGDTQTEEIKAASDGTINGDNHNLPSLSCLVLSWFMVVPVRAWCRRSGPLEGRSVLWGENEMAEGT